MSEAKNVYQLISEVTAKLCERGGVGKDQENTYDRYKFRGIDQVYDALAPIISSVGLVILPKLVEQNMEIRQGSKGTSLCFVKLTMEYTLVSAQDGSSCVVTMTGEGMDRSDKATNKALSAAYKYMCFQVFCIPLEGQDSEKESPELGKNPNSRAEPVAKTAAKESGAPMSEALSEAITSIKMSAFNDDSMGFYEVWDELDNDEKVTVFGALDQDTRKQCRAWQAERKESE